MSLSVHLSNKRRMIYKPIDDFVAFLDREVNSAVTELTKVAEASRKHLQKLVYTNVVDRFDSTIDPSPARRASRSPRAWASRANFANGKICCGR